VRCPPALLADLADVIAELRGWPDVLERTPFVFYARRLPFLHFHLVEGGGRRADIRGAAAWHSIDLPSPLTATKRRELLRELRKRYRERTARRAR
jgi:hypothetical protein